MTLDTQVKKMGEWNKKEAHECFVTFNQKYVAKYGGALHHSLMQGNLNDYIERECLTFARYAKMWNYAGNKQ